MTSTLTTLWTQQAALGTLDHFQWSVFPLNEDKRLLLEEKPNSFKIHFGRELKKHANGCFGESNHHLERQVQSHTKTALWGVVAGNAGNYSVSLKEIFFLYSQKDALENKSGKGQNSSPRSPHDQEKNRAQTSLGSGLMPIENDTQNAIEFPACPAFLQPIVLSSVSPENIHGQEEPEREWSEEELELLRELDELLENDDAMRYDWESSWDETDDPFLADLRIGATLCCGQPLSEQ